MNSSTTLSYIALLLVVTNFSTTRPLGPARGGHASVPLQSVGTFALYTGKGVYRDRLRALVTQVPPLSFFSVAHRDLAPSALPRPRIVCCLPWSCVWLLPLRAGHTPPEGVLTMKRSGAGGPKPSKWRKPGSASATMFASWISESTDEVGHTFTHSRELRTTLSR